MPHIDPDLLALMALGESDLPRTSTRHLDNCEHCQSELAALSRVTRLARASDPLEQHLEEPSEAVWDRIESELASQSSTHQISLPVVKHSRSERVLQENPTGRTRASRGHRASRNRWKQARPVWLLACACLLALMVGVTGTLLISQPWGTSPTVEKTAALKPLPAWNGVSGTARLEIADGQRELVIDLAAPAESSGYREVWLMSADLKKGISVGLLAGDSGRFVLPSDIAVANYPVVDISQEPNDGNPAHSGDSIVRGTF